MGPSLRRRGRSPCAAALEGKTAAAPARGQGGRSAWPRRPLRRVAKAAGSGAPARRRQGRRPPIRCARVAQAAAERSPSRAANDSPRVPWLSRGSAPQDRGGAETCGILAPMSLANVEVVRDAYEVFRATGEFAEQFVA